MLLHINLLCLIFRSNKQLKIVLIILFSLLHCLIGQSGHDVISDSYTVMPMSQMEDTRCQKSHPCPRLLR